MGYKEHLQGVIPMDRESILARVASQKGMRVLTRWGLARNLGWTLGDRIMVKLDKGVEYPRRVQGNPPMTLWFESDGNDWLEIPPAYLIGWMK